MGRKRPENKEFPTVGISPLGGNAVEATGPTHAAITNDDVIKVPLTYDERVGDYVSDLAIMEMDDLDIVRQRQRVDNDEKEFRARAGYQQT